MSGADPGFCNGGGLDAGADWGGGRSRRAPPPPVQSHNDNREGGDFFQ